MIVADMSQARSRGATGGSTFAQAPGVPAPAPAQAVNVEVVQVKGPELPLPATIDESGVVDPV